MSPELAMVWDSWQTNDKDEATAAQWGQMIHVRELAPQWQIQCIKDLISIQQLPQNWDSYGSPPPDDVAVDTAISLINDIDLENFQAPQVSPISGGAVQLEWRCGRNGIELEVLPDRTIEYLKTCEGEPVDEGTLSSPDPSVIRSLCDWLRAR